MAFDTAAQRRQALIGAGALLLGALMAWGATGISSVAGYAGVGPNFVPWVVALSLLACGAMLIWEAASGGWRELEEPSGAAQGDWRALAWVVGGLAIDAVTGMLIAAPAFWLFTKVLGISLPGLTATGWL
jgi:putative tricarboxylic transport membrane protein